ncbi:hypothetical protein TNCV_2339791 [Trichonephila clavipes]|nr:hypothetical protein TNCV_2339791 [Trichonephila clavipes]
MISNSKRRRCLSHLAKHKPVLLRACDLKKRESVVISVRMNDGNRGSSVLRSDPAEAERAGASSGPSVANDHCPAAEPRTALSRTKDVF